MEPVEVIATALETPYGAAVLDAAMIEPIRLPGDVREPIVVAELCEWPQGLPPLVGEAALKDLELAFQCANEDYGHDVTVEINPDDWDVVVK